MNCNSCKTRISPETGKCPNCGRGAARGTTAAANPAISSPGSELHLDDEIAAAEPAPAPRRKATARRAASPA